ncbi:MAG: CRISPR-associated endonuclease Cas2 [Bacteroidales bacterium]|nr:CRISPR-associated endonuclease Cas2 [Bacteroidaceae bacterium]MBR3940056.1 CRISPR-associated endonuclease Cas2 [Bacteroidales bacterium]
MNEIRLNAYHIMWLFVFFDLPTNTKTEKRNAALFRKGLEKDGFTMMQYSVYTRHCGSKESMYTHIKRVKKLIPAAGHINILSVTDKQFSEMHNFWGKIEKENPGIVQQLELF